MSQKLFQGIAKKWWWLSSLLLKVMVTVITTFKSGGDQTPTSKYKVTHMVDRPFGWCANKSTANQQQDVFLNITTCVDTWFVCLCYQLLLDYWPINMDGGLRWHQVAWYSTNDHPFKYHPAQFLNFTVPASGVLRKPCVDPRHDNMLRYLHNLLI